MIFWGSLLNISKLSTHPSDRVYKSIIYIKKTPKIGSNRSDIYGNRKISSTSVKILNQVVHLEIGIGEARCHLFRNSHLMLYNEINKTP